MLNMWLGKYPVYSHQVDQHFVGPVIRISSNRSSFSYDLPLQTQGKSSNARNSREKQTNKRNIQTKRPEVWQCKM